MVITTQPPAHQYANIQHFFHKFRPHSFNFTQYLFMTYDAQNSIDNTENSSHRKHFSIFQQKQPLGHYS